MFSESGFSLQDLMNDGPSGDQLRRSVADGVNAGAVDPKLCFQVAELCHNAGKEALALEFIDMGLLGDPESDEWPTLMQTVGVNALLFLKINPDPICKARIENFCRGLDQIDDDIHYDAMDAIATGLAKDTDAARIFLDEFGDSDGARNSQSIAGILLAASQFCDEFDRAGVFAGILSGIPDHTPFSFRLLIHFALLEGACGRAEALCKTAIQRYGKSLFSLCEMAVSLYCQDRYAEGRQVLAETVTILEGQPNVVERRRQIRTWSEQLQDAIENRTVDGGELANMGASIRYTRPDRVKDFYEAHRVECVEANKYRTVSGHTNHVMFAEVEKLLAANPNLRKVINYGTLCGIREYELSERYPDIVWAGYDISELATEWNRDAYARNNLLFDSDFEAMLAKLEKLPGDALLVHCRTMDIMLPEAVRRVYRACRESGVQKIMTAEYFSRSLPTLLYPDFAADPVDTVHWDGILVMHNYAKLFPETGYRIAGTEFRPVPILISASGEGLLREQMIELVHAELME
jgi:hypothetical protein